MTGKPWFASKTIHANMWGPVILAVAKAAGYPITTEEVLAVMAVINVILRFVTTQPIESA